MRITLIFAAAMAALAFLASQASAQHAQNDLTSPAQASGNVLVAQAAPPPQLTPPQPIQTRAAPNGAKVAQNMAQNVGVDDFQFNELDFDRQGGAAPAGPPLLPGPGTQAPGQDDNLINLFSDQPQAETLTTLPGAPSPTATPAAEGQAKIELSQPSQPAQDPCVTVPVKTPVRRRAARVRPMRSPEAQKGNRWYWAHEVWRDHPEVSMTDCQSYVTNRPLYNVRCFSHVADTNTPQPFVRY